MVYLHAVSEIGSTIPYAIHRKSNRAHMHLAPKDLHGPRRGDDPNWVHNCQNGKIGRLGRPPRVGSPGDLVAPSLD